MDRHLSRTTALTTRTTPLNLPNCYKESTTTIIVVLVEALVKRNRLVRCGVWVNWRKEEKRESCGYGDVNGVVENG